MTRALVERAQAGDHDAYEQLARSVSRRLFLVASRILRDTDAAEDAVQVTLVAIWRDLSTLRDPDRFEAWAYRMVVNACRTEARRLRRRGTSVADISAQIATTGDGLASVAVRDELDRAFDGLSVEHRTVVVLHHLAGMPLGEIADVLGIPYGTVGSRLHHAMRSMRASLDAADRAPARGGQTA